MRGLIWILSFVPVATFTGLVFRELSDTLTPGGGARLAFLLGLLALTLLAAATVQRALTKVLRTRGTTDDSGP